MLAALAVVAASTVTFGAAFATDESGGNQDNDDNSGNQINQNNRNGDNNVGDVTF